MSLFNLFKKDTPDTPPADAKAIRDHLLSFIKDQLSRVEGGEGANIKGLHLFIACTDTDKHLYESAVYFEEGDRFKNEDVQKIADDFAIDLPADWTMETTFVDTLPAEAIKAPGIDAALFIQTRKRSLQKQATAYIRVLNGEAENELYTIESTSGKITIGREKRVQSSDGFFRINTIAFPADSTNAANKYISRQHAHIEWDNDSGTFLLFADEGGLPPKNKVKVRPADGAAVKLQTDRIGHQLQEGDQIMLGETALLEFSYLPEK